MPLCVEQRLAEGVKGPEYKMPENTNVYFFDNVISFARLMVVFLCTFQKSCRLYFYKFLNVTAVLCNFISYRMYFRRMDVTLYESQSGEKEPRHFFPQYIIRYFVRSCFVVV